jgi:hypothetical protein
MALMRFDQLSDLDRQYLADQVGIGLVDEHGHVDPALLAALVGDVVDPVDETPDYEIVERTVIVEVRLGRLTWFEPRTVRQCTWLR